jgi:hypothetical protein
METINQNLEPKYQTCFETIIDRIDNEKKSFTNRELLEICRESADIFSGEANPHFCHEIAEAALNLLIRIFLIWSRMEETFRFAKKLLLALVLRVGSESKVWRARGFCKYGRLRDRVYC